MGVLLKQYFDTDTADVEGLKIKFFFVFNLITRETSRNQLRDSLFEILNVHIYRELYTSQRLDLI